MLYFLCRMIINEQALVSSRPMPIITPVGINTLLFAKIIIQIWIFAGDSKRVRSIVMRVSSKRETESISGNWMLDFACTFYHYFSIKFGRKLPWTPNNQSPMLSQKLSISLEKNSTSKCLYCAFSYKQNTEMDKLWLNFATSFTGGKKLRKVSFISLMYLM